MNDQIVQTALTTILSSLETISMECRQAIAQLPMREYDALVRSLAAIQTAYDALDAQFPQHHDDCPPAGIQRPMLTLSGPTMSIEDALISNRLWGDA